MAKKISELSDDSPATVQAFGSLGSPILLTRASISSPVSSIDLTLPTGYAEFWLSLSSFTMDAEDFLTFLASANAGSTFFVDNDNFDTYNRTYLETGLLNVVQTDRQIGYDQFMYNHSAIGAGEFYDSSVKIIPGDASTSFRITWESFFGDNANKPAKIDSAFNLNAGATVTPTYARINLLRIQPGGNFDFPATGTTVITGGNYSLWGIK